MGQIRYYYGVVIDDVLSGVRQQLRALHGAARAELTMAGEHGDTEAALDRLEAALKALEG